MSERGGRANSKLQGTASGGLTERFELKFQLPTYFHLIPLTTTHNEHSNTAEAAHIAECISDKTPSSIGQARRLSRLAISFSPGVSSFERRLACA